MQRVDNFLKRIPPALLRIVCALSTWFGLGNLVIGLIFLVLAGWAIVTGRPMPSKPPTPIRDAVLMGGQLFFWGVFFICLTFRLGRICGYAGMGVYSEARSIDEWSDRCRTIWVPNAEDFLHFWTVDFEEPIEEVKARIQSLPSRGSQFGLHLLRKDDRPVGKLRGNKVELVAPGMRSLHSTWTGRMQTNSRGGTTIAGVLTSHQIVGYTCKDGLFRSVWCAGMMLGGATLFSKGMALGFVFWLAPLQMWLINTLNGGIGRWSGLRHERQLEKLFKGTLGAQAIYLKPRYEIFSIEWIKNLLQSR